MSQSGDGLDVVEKGPMKNVTQGPAFNPSQLVKKKRFNGAVQAKKTLGAIQSLGSNLAHPKEAIKNKATKTTAKEFSKAERPYLSKNADLELLEAHENLKHIKNASSARLGQRDVEEDDTVVDHKEKIQRMEAQRESMRAAWFTSRQVRRVRVIAKRYMQYPELSSFAEFDSDGKVVRYDWLEWLGHILLYFSQNFSAQYIDDFDHLPFNVDSMRHNIERLVMASAPWQQWLMNVRAVYRWEDPKLTAKWLALFVFLWHTEHIVGFFYLYVLYFVLKNRFRPSSIESLRSSMQRALDSRSKAYNISELIDKHGHNEWLDPFMEAFGPHIQLQIGDLATLLEVLFNFYNWKSPRKTFGTLFFFAVCVLVTLLTDMRYCVKIVWFIAGGAFFCCYPVSSRYPKHRYLVSPLKWVLWDVPSHAEWSFQYLRRQAQEAREQMIEQKVDEQFASTRYVETYVTRVDGYESRGRSAHEDVSDQLSTDDDDSLTSSASSYHSVRSSTSILDSTDIRSFRAYHTGGITGRLIVFSNGIHFVRSRFSFPFAKHGSKSQTNGDIQAPNKDTAKGPSSDDDRELWRYTFLSLVEMRKFNDHSDTADGSALAGRLVKAVSSLGDPDLGPRSGVEGGGMEITLTDGTCLVFRGMIQRDEAFNTIIAFSGLQWQSMSSKRRAESPVEG